MPVSRVPEGEEKNEQVESLPRETAAKYLTNRRRRMDIQIQEVR